MGPSSTIGAREPAWVMVFQWPCGAWPTARSPFFARAYKRVVLVFTPGLVQKHQAIQVNPRELFTPGLTLLHYVLATPPERT